jgi:hypothetical protein
MLANGCLLYMDDKMVKDDDELSMTSACRQDTS